MYEPTSRDNEWEIASKHLAMIAWYRYTGEDFCDPEIKDMDYDHDGIPLCGPNGDVETWVDSEGIIQTTPAHVPSSDDDMDNPLNLAFTEKIL